MKHGECVSGARLAVHRDEHATTGGQGLENSSIMRLKTDTPQRSRQPKLREIACWTLEGADQRSPGQKRSSRAGLYMLTLRPQRRLDERAHFRGFFRDDAERLRRQA